MWLFDRTLSFTASLLQLSTNIILEIILFIIILIVINKLYDSELKQYVYYIKFVIEYVDYIKFGIK